MKCNDTCSLVIRNAKIKNTTESTSIGIYINDSEESQSIELENLIIVTGISEGDFSILKVGDDIDIKNLLLFVKKAKSASTNLLIGDVTNFKYIIDENIS